MQLLSPVNWFSWGIAFAEAWIFSRETVRLYFGLPFFLALTSTIGFFVWLRYSSDSVVIAHTLDAIAKAEAANDVARVENGLNALINLRPTDPAIRFRLGQFLISNDRKDGLAHILGLAPDQTDGYAPARLWLVNQAMSPNPVLPLDEDQIEGQLLKVLRTAPDHTESQILLAELYIKKSEWNLAEKHLTAAIKTNPILSVKLARVKQTLGRPIDDITKLLDQGAAALQDGLSNNRTDDRYRIALAETFSMLGRRTEARALLESGYNELQSPELLTALSDFDLQIAGLRLQQTLLNKEACQRIVESVISRQPGHPGIVTEMTRLAAAGCVFSRDHIQPSLDFWSATRTNQNLGDDQREQATLNLAQLFSSIGDFQSAIDVIRPLVASRASLRQPFARLLIQAGQTTEGLELANDIIAEQQSVLDSNPSDEQAFIQLLDAKRLVSSPQTIVESIADWIQSEQKSDSIISTRLQILYGGACLENATELEKQLQTADTAQQKELSRALVISLQKAAMISVTRSTALNRLAALQFSDSAAARPAADVLHQLRASGDPKGEIQLLLGTQGLLSEKYEQAISYLEGATVQAKNRDAGILNNLAIALVRCPHPQPDRAFQCIETAREILPDHIEIQATRGEVLVALERWEEAKAELQQVLPARSNDPMIHQLLHRTFSALNDQAMANVHLQRFEELSGHQQ